VFIELLLRSYGLTSVNQGNCLVIEDRNGGQLFVSSSDREISHALDAEDVQRLRDFKGEATELRIERINLQLAGDLDARAKRAQLYDFGHINVRAEFHNPLASTVSDQWLCIGGVLWPESPAFVLPHPELAAPLAEWHKYKLNDFCFGLARDFRMQTIGRAMVQEAMENRLSSLVNGWPAAVHELAAAPESR
jgi:hypothetical protein